MKKISFILGLLLLLMMLVPSSIIIYLNLKQLQAKKIALEIIKQKKPNKTFVFLRISKADELNKNSGFFRVHSREFVWQGTMYDIVEKYEEENYTTYLVYPDYKETSIRKKANAIHNKLENDVLNTGRKVKNSVTINWFQVFCKSVLNFGFFEVEAKCFFCQNIFSEWIVSPIEKPPTKLLFNLIY